VVKLEDAVALARSLPRLLSLLPARHPLHHQGPAGAHQSNTRSCVGFDDKDEEVLWRGARIQQFDVGGSKLVDELEDEFVGGGGFCDLSYIDVM
jgi:hypothetical protein